MGNCVNSRQVVSWADDDEEWGLMEEGEEVTAGDAGAASSSSSVVVKMRITKKQLSELLRVASKKGVDVQRLLAHVMNTGAVYHDGGRATQWRPRLESIPETSENDQLLM